MSAEPSFIHLRVHSAYSLLEGMGRVAELAELAAAEKMPALAVTDRNNLFGALEIAEALAAKGVQPIIGASLTLIDGDAEIGTLALLVKDRAGYENLMALVSAAHLDTPSHVSVGCSLDALCAANGGLICLSGGVEGPANRAVVEGRASAAAAILSRLQAAFGDRFYIELQRYPDFEAAEVEAFLLDFAYENGVPLVATNQCFFLREAQYAAHDALLCIAGGHYVGEAERRRLTPHHRLKSAAEMGELFADIPEALANSVEIARRCAFRPEVQEPILPAFECADEVAELRRQAETGLQARLAEAGIDKADDYQKRLDYELGVIVDMGFAGYFLIVADFIKWAKQAAIAVGPGRGSGAGSVVAWALTITDLDPLRFNLLFERFLNPDRVSMPDFDIDFCQTRRDEVLAYVQEKYGRERVAQIITFGTLQPRAVLRDVGRVLQIPYSRVDELCRMVPNNPSDPLSLQQAIDGEPRLQEAKTDAAIAELIAISLQLEGLYRHASTHAAGLVIGQRPLVQDVALYRDPKSDMPVTQFNMKWVEKAGLVKFDFLGLKTLTVLEKTLELLAGQGVTLDLANLALDDSKTFALLGAGDTIGVFQLESLGMRDVLRKMRPDSFEDIIALVALYRPGPMDNIPRYIACKKGESQPDYLHPLIEPILQETYGVAVYQEQVMQIAQELSGFSLGEADLLRRAMGKKIKEEMAAQRTRFIEGARERGVDDAKAAEIFKQVEVFAGYGFNKSHAAAYGLLAYQTAYMKANYPVAFFAALMTLDFDRTDKIDQFVQDARKRDIVVRPPDINQSLAAFRIDGNQIYYALAAIRNVGRGAVQALVAAREAGGAFSDVFDFARRAGAADGQNRRALENLIAAGAFDSLEPDRARLNAGIKILLGEAAIAQADAASQQDNLFGEKDVSASLTLPAIAAWSPTERLEREYAAVGFYLSGHPLDEYAQMTKRARAVPLDKADSITSQGGLIAATLMQVTERKNKQGRAFAFLTLSDPSGQIEVMVFSKTLAAEREKLAIGKSFVFGVKPERNNEQARLIVESVREIDELAAANIGGLRIYIDKPDACRSLKSRLDEARAPEKGGGEISLLLMGGQHDVEIGLAGRYAINPRLAGALKALPGVVQIEEL